MVTGQSVNDNQTRHSSLTTQPSRTNTYPALSLSLCLSATLSLSNTHTLAAVFAFCVSSLEHVSFLLLFFSLSVSLAVCSPPSPLFLCRPPWNWSFLSNVFLFDRDVIEDVCLTAVSTEALRVQASLFMCVCVVIMSWGGQFHRVFTVSVRWSRESVCMWTILVCQS